MKTHRGLPPQPKFLLANGKRPCRGCGGELTGRQEVWCSRECRERHYMALSGYARAKVFERDKGICAKCGADTAFLERMHWILLRADQYGDVDGDGAFGLRLLKVAWGLRDGAARWATWRSIPNLWEADHAIPLAEGGTHDLSNYRTLCVPCHKEETRLLAGRLAAARKGAVNVIDKGVDSPERSG